MVTKGDFPNLLIYIKKMVLIFFLIVYLVVFNLYVDVAQCQEIISDGNTDTSINSNGNITDITTGTISQNTGFNSFEKFNIDNGNIVNLYLPGTTENLINTINGDTSYINGIVNSIMNGDIGGNIYFLNPHGIIVGETGTINVGSLTAVTPTNDFINSMYDSNGNLSTSFLTDVLDGNIPISNSGLITVSGKVNAINDINLQSNDVTINSGATTGAITTGAVFSTDTGSGNTDKISFSDVVNVNGVNQGASIALENGDIYIEAANDIESNGIIAADGANNLDAGSISLKAGNNINLNNGSKILSRAEGANSNSGNISIIAEKTDKPKLVEADARTGIYIDGAVLEGNDIVINAESDADYSWSVDDPHDLATGTVSALGSSMAGVGVGITKANASSEIIINNGSRIKADGKVDIKSDSKASAGMISLNPNLKWVASVGFVYGSVESNSNVDVQDDVKIQASDFSVASINNTDLDVQVYAISPSASATEAAIAVTNADVNSSVNIDSEVNLDIGNTFTASSINNNSFSTTTTAMSLGAGNAGIAATIFDADTNADTSIAADILNIEDLTIESLNNISKNKATASAIAGSGFVQRKLLGGVSKGTDFIKNKLSSSGPTKLNSDSGATAKPKLAGAVTIANTDNSATAVIEDSTDVGASGDVVVTANVVDAGLQNHAISSVESNADGDSSNPTATYSLSAAVNYGDHDHTADAHIGADSNITAGNLGVSSNVFLPYDITWHKWEGISTITSKLNSNLGIANGFLTGFANATGTPSKAGIAGSVNYM
ncbi:MAG: leukotoxin LktA family filamentous adhesin, partial [bacterium]